ncbi:MAG: RNA 2',3'-cyclic phosphodiesterase [Methanotrichaceae archaeon]|nr:RNA 2',3'-cyclic phosphodiesterase [Methanotrichaceae archaeon]
MSDIRCFVAVDLPESMREDIGRVQRELALPGLRLVRPELVHVTLKFLGEVPESRVQKIAQALREIEASSFQAGVKGMGAFPGRSIRVVWLGLEGDFQGLYQKVEEALGPLGFKREERGFSPHVTIGRVGRPDGTISRQLAPKIEQFADLDLGRFTVNRFFLKKSTLTRGGPIYDNLEEYPLRDFK